MKKNKKSHIVVLMWCRIFLLCSFFLSVSAQGKQLPIKIQTPHAILINAETGKILYEKNAREAVYPASTTKVATALYVLRTVPERFDDVILCTQEALQKTSEQAKLAHDFVFPAHWLESDGNNIDLRVNEKMCLRDLLYGAMLSSGNDACNVLAEYVAQDIPTFTARLNDLAKEIGCVNTHFCNPHGLHHPEHVTCAYDTALFAMEAMKYPQFQEIVSTVRYSRPKTNLRSGGEFVHTNALLNPRSAFYYPYAIGIKTGVTKMAKHNIVAAATNGERTLIAVLHKSPTAKQRYQDAILLFDTAFAEAQEERLLFKGRDSSFSKTLKKGDRPLVAEIIEDVFLHYYPSEESEIYSQVEWLDISLPITQGDIVAELIVYSEEGNILLREPLFSKYDIKIKKIYQLQSGIVTFIRWFIFPLALPIFSLLVIFILYKKKIKALF